MSALALLLARIASNHRAVGPTTAYRDAVLADAPVLYWRLNETSGTVAADSSTSSHPGTYAQNASTLTAVGLLGTDTDKGILAPTGFTGVFAANPINTSASWTLEAWIKPMSAPAVVSVIALLGDAVGAPEIDVLPLAGGTTYALRVMRSGQSVIFQSAATLAYGTRVHIALKCAGGGNVLTLYINGAIDTAHAGAYAAFGGNVVFGYDSRDANYAFIGYLDEFSLYQAALSDARALAHYNAGA